MRCFCEIRKSNSIRQRSAISSRRGGVFRFLDLKNVHLPCKLFPLHLFNPHQIKTPEGEKIRQSRAWDAKENNSLVCIFTEWTQKDVRKEKKYPQHIASIYLCTCLAYNMLQNADVIQPTEKLFFCVTIFFLLIGHQGDPFPLALCPHRQKRLNSML